MLIKVQECVESHIYRIFEDCNHVSYSERPEYCYDRKELRKRIEGLTLKSGPSMTYMFLPDFVFDSIYEPHERVAPPPSGDSEPITKDEADALEFLRKERLIDFEKQGYRFSWVKFLDSEFQEHLIIFEGIAYLCNGEGRTAHKIQSSGLFHRPPFPQQAGQGIDAGNPAVVV